MITFNYFTFDVVLHSLDAEAKDDMPFETGADSYVSRFLLPLFTLCFHCLIFAIVMVFVIAESDSSHSAGARK